MIRLHTKIFNKPYTLAEAGRGSQKTFAKPRAWIEPAVKQMWKTYTKDKNLVYMFFSKIHTSKFQSAIIAGESVPFSGPRCVLVHREQLKEQHLTHLNHWVDTNYVKQNWIVDLLQGTYKLIEKANKDISKLDDKEIEKLNTFKKIEFLVLDEPQKYTKGNEEKIKMLIEILDYLKRDGSLKHVLMTTATGKNLKAIWQWANSYYDQHLYTYTPTAEQLAKDNWIGNSVNYIWADQKTTVVDLKDLEKNNIDISNAKQVKKYCSELTHTGVDSTLVDLKNSGHTFNFSEKIYKNFQTQIATYIKNRFDASITHWIQNCLGEATLIAVQGIDHAIALEKEYNLKLKAYGYQCIAWNGKTKNNHPVYKDNEKKMLTDVVDDKNCPIKIIIVNGMLKEGTNKNFYHAYNTVFSVNNVDTSTQFFGRAKNGYVIIDAPLIKTIPNKKEGMNMMRKIMEDNDIALTEDELEKMWTQFHAQNELDNADATDGKEYSTGMSEDELAAQAKEKTKFPTTHGGVILNSNIWVYDMTPGAKVLHFPLPTGYGLHRSLDQGAQSLIEIFSA